jgi:hypothetical protein
MQIQYAENINFLGWYCPQQRKMKDDREMRFLNNLRVNFIHFRTPIVSTGKQLTVSVSARLEYSEGHPLYGTPFPESAPTVIVPPKIKATNVIFKAGETIGKKSLPDDTEVIPFCRTQLGKLEKLVSECEKQFNKPPRNPCDKIHNDAPSDKSS